MSLVAWVRGAKAGESSASSSVMARDPVAVVVSEFSETEPVNVPATTGALLIDATVIVEVTAEELSSPSLTIQEMVRSAVLGLLEVLL